MSESEKLKEDEIQRNGEATWLEAGTLSGSSLCLVLPPLPHR